MTTDTEVKPLTADQAEKLIETLRDYYAQTDGVRFVDHPYLQAIADGRHVVIDATELEQLRADARLAIALDVFEHEARQLPLGHECPSKGCSTYNWRMDAVRRIRGLMAEVSFNVSAKEGAAIDAVQQEVSNDR